ncbi:carbohydrate-binding protein [Microbulbifer agarilyticus]|uniref:carbohydrate-binding protein n=1 Tax=Microbulbifer agarilyticus TaxID=260552 RepID=UPI001CD395E2|nr:carbohydrate-binding protein [Microbulbifer agarilyticus]MCA0892487.1 carbohydrate-binding protein [Microbulbifer agarilyticus]
MKNESGYSYPAGKVRKTMLLAALALMSSSALAVEPLSVNGNQVLVGGQPGSVAGNSFFWSNNGWGGEKFYNSSIVSWLKSDWKSGVVRAAMGVEDPGGYFDDPAGNEAKVRAIVDAAIANDMYVIIDWHSHYANEHDWSRAVNFFSRMAADYGHTNNVIYEIFNEPKQVSWSSGVKPYAESVISSIRSIDPDNLIIVGTPNWSQDVDDASFDPIQGHANIAYGLHFYSGSHGQWLRDKAQTALNNGIALFVTEWGTVNADGNGGVNYGETDAWMEFLKNNNISHANWSINDKPEGASALVPGASATGNWAPAQLTASGNKVRDIILNWGGPAGGDDCDSATAVNVPGRIEAEAFCGADGVQTETTSDTGGGENVGYIDIDDWMAYRINVPAAGNYEISYRVAANGAGGVLQFEGKGGAPVYGQLDVPNTGDWQSWTTISHTVSLPAGDQQVAVAAVGPGWNINWLDIQSTDSGNETIKVEAENYTFMEGVQVEATSDVGGGQNVGYLDDGDWMAYHGVNVPSAGNYRVEFRVASQGGGQLSFERAGGSPLYGTLNVPATGDWQNWTTISMDVYLDAGSQDFGIGVPIGGWNLNWFSLTKLD